MNMFSRSDTHPFLQPLEQHWQQIKAEYLAIANHVSEWPETAIHNGLWDIYGIFFAGQRLDGEQSCPLTAALVHSVPGLFIAGFSILRPGCVILPHVGYTDSVWRSHLGLICPPGAWIEVGGQRHDWCEGESVVFDDTYSHHAVNDGDSDRVILIVDFKKP